MSKVFVAHMTGRSPVSKQTIHRTAKGAVDHALKTGPFYREVDRQNALALIEGRAPYDSAYFFVKDPIDGGSVYGVMYVAITPGELMP